jgi:penicillin-binding protein 1A
MEENTPHIPSEPAKKSKRKKLLIGLLWSAVLGPFLLMAFMLYVSADDDMPSLEQLENPKSNLATTVYTADGEVLGSYFRENRTTAKFHQLSPHLVNALISTEDERFRKHSGVDLQALGRVVKGVATGSKSTGGGSTLSQQLSKLLFPRTKLNTWGLVKRKFKEWIIATRLEKQYTKEEILTMYFNQLDFLNLAVGINSAAQVYFSTTPDSLKIEEAAMLVGMAKNPSIFNPLRRPDTTQQRRNVVLYQMKKNGHISQQEFDSLKQIPLEIRYTKVDHQEGIAPYFRETLRQELKRLLTQKNDQGESIYTKPDGTTYDIYSDGLKIYTSIDSRMQRHAEYAVEEHLKYYLQEAFHKNNKLWKNAPFSNDLSQEQIDGILNTAKKNSQYYKKLTGQVCSYCERPKAYLEEQTIDGKKHYHCSHCQHNEPVRTEKEIDKLFETPRPMRVFTWKAPNFEKDTSMSPLDSIIYYKGFLRAGLMSMDPHTGLVKAWVGGPNFKYFKYDHVKARRQVGSTFKPFVYAAALRSGIFSPCDKLPNIQYCVDVPHTQYQTKQWCPSNSGEAFDGSMTPLTFALAASMNNITAKVIKETSPQLVINLIKDLGIDTSLVQPVPSMALGVFDLSVYEMVGAISAYANKGVYIEPIIITRIEDNTGTVIYEAIPKATEALDEITAFTMLEMMKNVTRGIAHPTAKSKTTGRPLIGGTALRIRGEKTKERPYAGLKTPIAGKTGTTQNQSDGWFLGLTPDLVTGVWVGAEDRSVRFRSLQLGMGTNTALPIWAYYMNKIYDDKRLNISQGDFERPLSLTGIDILNCNSTKEERKINEFDVWDIGY